MKVMRGLSRYKNNEFRADTILVSAHNSCALTLTSSVNIVWAVSTLLIKVFFSHPEWSSSPPIDASALGFEHSNTARDQ